MVKRIAVSAFVILMFVIYSIHQRTDGAAAVTQVIKNNSSSPQSTVQATQDTPMNSSNSRQYKNGTYKGSQEYAFYGYIQVQATVSDGKLSDVYFLQYPNDRDNSIAINDYAMPILKQQAIAAQAGNVDGVSGATDSSQAFMQSLNKALLQAKA